MSLMTKIKYAYLFAFLIILISILIITCIKVTIHLINILIKDKYIWYMEVEQRSNTITTSAKITILSIIGVLDSIALFTIISKIA